MRFLAVLLMLLVVLDVCLTQRVFDMMDDRRNNFIPVPREAYAFRRKMFLNPIRFQEDRWKKSDYFE